MHLNDRAEQHRLHLNVRAHLLARRAACWASRASSHLPWRRWPSPCPAPATPTWLPTLRASMRCSRQRRPPSGECSKGLRAQHAQGHPTMRKRKKTQDSGVACLSRARALLSTKMHLLAPERGQNQQSKPAKTF